MEIIHRVREKVIDIFKNNMAKGLHLVVFLTVDEYLELQKYFYGLTSPDSQGVIMQKSNSDHILWNLWDGTVIRFEIIKSHVTSQNQQDRLFNIMVNQKHGPERETVRRMTDTEVTPTRTYYRQTGSSDSWSTTGSTADLLF